MPATSRFVLVFLVCASMIGSALASPAGAQPDTEPPELEIREPFQNATSDRTPRILVSYLDRETGLDLSTLSIRVDAADITATCTVASETAECESPTLLDGSHTVFASVSDVAGNEATTSFTFEVDGSPPILALGGPSSVIFADGFESGDIAAWGGGAPLRIFYATTTQQIEIAYSDAVSGPDRPTLSILLDGVEIVTTCTVDPALVSCDLGSLAEGVHDLVVTLDDRIGNTATLVVELTVDLTAPTLTASADPPANAAGWNSTPVTVTFDCADALSGVVTCPPPRLLDIAGEDQVVSASVIDRAGNEASVEITLSLDLAPPVFDPADLEPAPCPTLTTNLQASLRACFADDLSGIDLGTVNLEVDGLDRTAESTVVGNCIMWTPATDFAPGDHSATARIADVAGGEGQVDWCFSIASPTLTIDILQPADSLLTTDMLVDVSGTVDELAEVVTVNGVTATLDTVAGTFEVLGVELVEGINTLEAVAFNSLGGLGQDTVSVTRDSTPPTIQAAYTPPPNSFGWNNTDVTVSFTCTDAVSGVDSCPDPITVTSEGADQDLEVSATDVAGNTVPRTYTVSVDKTAPSLAAVPDPAANAAGWNNTPVSVAFDCNDALSGLASCSAPRLVASEGAGQSVSGSATDRAGNSATTGATVSLDLTPPVVDVGELRPVECPDLTMTAQPQVRSCFSDLLSGVAAGGVSLSVDEVDRTGDAILAGGCIAWDPSASLDIGEHGAEVAVSDLAGNVTTRPWCFEIALSPIAITIDSPPPNFLTSDAAVDVSGTVEDGVTQVDVNGVVATVAGTTFTATGVPLSEGKTLVTAIARTVDGNSGTATVVVLRDTTPPQVRLETPRNGAVLTSLQADVAGLVNDLIGGTTINLDDCDVTVNGVEAMVANRSFLVPDLLLKRGVNTLVAVATDRMGNIATDTIQVTVQDLAGQRIVLLAGNGQEASIFDELPDRLVVALEDADGDSVVGRPVNFRVSRGDGTLSAFPQEGTEVTVLTDELGHASVVYELGARSGAGNNRVLATAPGFVGEVEFCANSLTGVPVRIVANAGDQQSGAVEEPLAQPLVVLVTDAGGNAVGGVDVTFAATRGGATFGGSPAVVRTTDLDGLAQVELTLGPEAGVNNTEVEASFVGLVEGSATFTATAQRIGQPSQTRVSGVVLDNQDIPIEGATVTIDDTALEALTDVEGRFSLVGAPVGMIGLHIDGSTTPRPGVWPSLHFELTTTAGRDNTVGRPIYLLPIDVSSTVPASSTEDLTLTLANVPGAELTVYGGSVTCPGGGTDCEVSATQVRGERVPMAPPLGSTFMIAWTIQPAGAHFDPPARICIPNADLAPGQQTEIFSFDHDQGEFIAVGTATVADDGSQLCSDPGFGVVKAGWHGCAPPPPPCSSACNACPPPPNVCQEVMQVPNGCGGCTCETNNKPDGTMCMPADGCASDGMCMGGSCDPQDPPEISGVTAMPATLELGEDMTINYTVDDPMGTGFDSVEVRIENNAGTVIYEDSGGPTAPGSHMVTWTGGKWNQAPHMDAFANPNNGPYTITVVGIKNGNDCSMDDAMADTELVIEAKIKDEIPAGAMATEAAGLDDMLDALKIVLKNGADETVFTGMAQIMAMGPDRFEQDIMVDDPGLNSLADGDYEVLFRDLRDEIGNWTDDDGNLMNGIQPLTFDLPLW